MRTVRLGRRFDCVFVHDAVMYMTTESDLRRAIETAFVHCRPGGAALFAPDHVRENFRSSTDHGGHDGEREGLRYLEWAWDPDPTDTTYVVDDAYLLREGDGSVRVEHDRHIEGLFYRADWLRLLSEAGFQPSVVPFEHSELEAGTYEFFVARKPLALPVVEGPLLDTPLRMMEGRPLPTLHPSSPHGGTFPASRNLSPQFR